MQKIKSKVIFLIIGAVFFLFFNNSFGIVDIEKMAIITAIGIDMEDDLYSITAQIAVPEEDSTHTEKKKTHLVGKGVTVGDAIREISDFSGWYPQLVFCNLLVVGKDFEDKNVLTTLDYFAKTLRIQDSALVVFSTTKAKDLLSESSPLDNISSFALQKILYKKAGFSKDVAENNIKQFCAGYYSRASSSYMPIIKTVKIETAPNDTEGSNANKQMNAGGSSASNSTSDSAGSSLFNAKSTALFRNGVKVGELDEDGTTIYNILTNNFSNSTIPLTNIKDGYNENTNYMLNVLKSNSKMAFEIDNLNIYLLVDVNIFCKIGDQNSKSSHESLSKNNPLPQNVKDALEEKLYNNIYSYFQTLKQTNCDMLSLDEKLYRHYNKHYSTFKDNLLEDIVLKINVNVSGQK